MATAGGRPLLRPGREDALSPGGRSGATHWKRGSDHDDLTQRPRSPARARIDPPDSCTAENPNHTEPRGRAAGRAAAKRSSASRRSLARKGDRRRAPKPNRRRGPNEAEGPRRPGHSGKCRLRQRFTNDRDLPSRRWRAINCRRREKRQRHRQHQRPRSARKTFIPDVSRQPRIDRQPRRAAAPAASGLPKQAPCRTLQNGPPFTEIPGLIG